MSRQEQLRVFIAHATTEQITASWIREQEYRRDRGEPHYLRLVEPDSGRVVASIGAQA